MVDTAKSKAAIKGEFIDMEGERYYVIHNVEKMAPFFISLVSDSDHWMFVASNGGLTAGRVSPETALFPYIPVDRIYENIGHTGSKTLLKITQNNQYFEWEPYNKDFNHQYKISQNLYKNTLGNKICFEEINHDLKLAFRYTWKTSEEFGFCRSCELHNFSDQDVSIQMVDGLQNILPAGTPRLTQTGSSNLIDAYKWSELHPSTGTGIFSLYSGITDRAQPSEALKANTVFCLGFDDPKVLLSNSQLDKFRANTSLQTESHKRGIRGAYLINVAFMLPAESKRSWQIVANIEQSQKQVVELIKQIEANTVEHNIAISIEKGSDALARIMGATDGYQQTSEETVSVHHYANTLFNTLRGGLFDDQYHIDLDDFVGTVKVFNLPLFNKHQQALTSLPGKLEFNQFIAQIQSINDKQLDRLAAEYLPVTFGRRHGDPSRPWNQFEIKLTDAEGKRFLSYQGNWRDIFQNWEALTFSYPEFIESVIAKFVNASTIDGYNPYRITKGGIDWEIEEPEDPWSFIGYWGDHQIIYLLKMLELSAHFHPKKLDQWLSQPMFGYANVPYRIKAFADILQNAKSTVEFDEQAAFEIDEKIKKVGADGKLLWDKQGQVYQVNLLEKLLVPLLAKLANLVLDGGIWLNTQRPEWNDANNALVGQGLSVVTLNYLRRYVDFLQHILARQSQDLELSAEVATWLTQTAEILAELSPNLPKGKVSDEMRYQVTVALGEAASEYRIGIYQQGHFSHKVKVDMSSIGAMLADALTVIDHSITNSNKEDGLFHAYNLLVLNDKKITINHLYPMLEGQVAALSSGAMSPKKAAEVVEALYASDIYRPDQQTFMLYPDKSQTGFLDKNKLKYEQVVRAPSLVDMLKNNDNRIILKDANNDYRFNARVKNNGDLVALLTTYYPNLSAENRDQIESLYEEVFNHQAFTGRSGGMFGFEGLGCVYWHMVSKLLLAVQENFFKSVDAQDDALLVQRLGALYYRIRQGIGFNKMPEEYGAFPCDPYSHTPKHAGAQQPGMTGQVKEEILTRFGELGIRVANGIVRFEPTLLREQEFASTANVFKYLDVLEQWQHLKLPENSLAFTWCQVPIIYQLTDGDERLIITLSDGQTISDSPSQLDAQVSNELFNRSGKIQSIQLMLTKNNVFSG